MEELKKYINLLDMNEKNIKRKNIACTLTIITELIKVTLTLLFFDKLSTILIKTILIYSIISAIFSIYILFNDDYKKFYKYLILDLSGGIFLFSNIISGILIELIILPIDKELIKLEYERQKEEKIKKPTIKNNYPKEVYLFIFISIIIGYQFLYINDLVFYILVFISLVYFFKRELIESFKFFKRQKKRHIRYIFDSFFKIYILNVISFTIIGLIVGADSTNQALIEQEAILFNIIFSILYAPIAEELLFRGCLRKLIKKDTLFIIISGILFGAWHVIGYDQSLIQYLYIIPYSIIGIGLSYIYTKTNNLTTNIGVHALNNILATIGYLI